MRKTWRCFLASSTIVMALTAGADNAPLVELLFDGNTLSNTGGYLSLANNDALSGNRL